MRPSLSLGLFFFAATVSGTSIPGQQHVWVDRVEAPSLDVFICPEGGPGGGPAMIRSREIKSWDGVRWQTFAELPYVGIQVTAITFDRTRGRSIVLAQVDGVPGPTRTFELTPEGAWLELGPGPALDGLPYYDPATGGVISHSFSLFGPVQDSLWTGSTWMPLPANGRPAYLRSFVADHARGRLVGVAPTFAGMETWEWDGTTWTRRAPAVSPTLLNSFRLGFDPVLGRVVLFGGSTSGTPPRETWTWDGSTWRLETPQNSPPTIVAGRVPLALDRRRGQLVHFDTAQGLYHAWTGTDWTLVHDASTASSFVQYAIDPIRNVLVRHGDDFTREWDGLAWTAPTFGPSTRDGAMAFDFSSLECVLFGGLRPRPNLALPPAVFGDTLSWNGSRWTPHAPPTAPAPRHSHAMLTSVRSGGVILHGGVTAMNQGLSDTWLFTLGTWIDLSPSLTVSPAPGVALGASGPLGVDPHVLSRSSLWRWDGSWVLLDQNAPPLDQRGFGLTSSGVPVVTGRNTSGFESHMFVNGSWRRQGDPSRTFDDMARDPRRGTLLAFDRGDMFAFSDVPAVETSYGTGCGAPAPQLQCAGDPVLDSPGYVLDAYVRPSAATLLVLGTMDATLPLGGGCTLRVDPTASTTVFLVANGDGRASVPIPLPANPALRGFEAYAQAATLQSGGPLGGIALTAGLRIRVGD